MIHLLKVVPCQQSIFELELRPSAKLKLKLGSKVRFKLKVEWEVRMKDNKKALIEFEKYLQKLEGKLD